MGLIGLIGSFGEIDGSEFLEGLNLLETYVIILFDLFQINLEDLETRDSVLWVFGPLNCLRSLVGYL